MWQIGFIWLGLEHWEEVKKTQKVYIQMWHVLQSEVSEKNDSNKLSVDPRSRSRSNSGALCIPKDFDPKRRRNSSLAVIDRRWFIRQNWSTTLIDNIDRHNWLKKLIEKIDRYNWLTKFFNKNDRLNWSTKLINKFDWHWSTKIDRHIFRDY